MRLSLFEIKNILHLKDAIFGKNLKLYLFGSRVDDSAKGGDIDLYLKVNNLNNVFEKKVEFLSQLQRVLGEQKIDLVFSRDELRLVDKEVLSKGVELSLDKIKLQKYFNECDKHLQRIEEAYDDIGILFPLSVEKYKNLSKSEVQPMDQYLFRFAKLQDTMGDKIFKLIVQVYDQSSVQMSFVDILNRLEKIGFLNSSKEWLNLRVIRNEIAHQYDDEPEAMSQSINNIVNQKEIIKEIYLKIKNNYLQSSASLNSLT